MLSLQAKLLILPVIVNVMLVVVTGIRLARARLAAGKAGLVDRKRVAMDNTAWPDDVRKLSNNYANQFEFPVVFYALAPLLVLTELVDAVQIVLAYIFVALRIAHSVVHTGSNIVMNRFKLFLASVATATSMWLWFAARLFITG